MNPQRKRVWSTESHPGEGCEIIIYSGHSFFSSTLKIKIFFFQKWKRKDIASNIDTQYNAHKYTRRLER